MGKIMKICKKDHVSFLQKKTTFGELKLGQAPYRVKIKFVKTEGLCMQKNKLGLTVSTQKTIIQTNHPSLINK
jgi:hypothetical protein